MTTTGEPDENPTRRRLAELVEHRRIDLNLSIRQAAANAGVARNTWSAVEDATRRTIDSNYAGIERALYWAPGSISRILNGGDPQEITPPPAADPPPTSEDAALIQVMRSNLTDQQKARIIWQLVSEREEHNRQLLERANSLIDRPPNGG